MSAENETDQSALRAELAETIRKDSAGTRLTLLEEIEARYPDAPVRDLLPSRDYSDIRRLDGERGCYYFSVLSITESYARHLYRIEERNPVNLIAETVREESRIYPRPTALKSFREPPFLVPETELSALASRMGTEPETEDIVLVSASNGAPYLYSTRHLEKVHAEALVEYYEVERWNNP